MLVLSRGKNESVMIGQDVEIVVADIRGNKVRLGITAPRWLAVHRREVHEAIHREEFGEKTHAHLSIGRKRNL